MLAFAIRRAIWAIPTLLGVSLVVFVLTTLLPDPGASPGAVTTVTERVARDELRRSRFLDLPRLFNVAPRDVRSTVDRGVRAILEGREDAEFWKMRLATIGGAALPHVLPRLERLSPEEAAPLALALAPIARRMQVGSEEELKQPERAVLFWKRFWADRAVDFTEPSVRRSVKRFLERPSDMLERDLRLVDTFALRAIMVALEGPLDRPALERLTRLLTGLTGRGEAIDSAADQARARAVVADWLSWWFVHERDYVVLEGGLKLTASLGQTRYAKWMLGALTGRLGLSTRDGLPIFDKLAIRAPVTLGIASLALLLSVLVGVPIGVVAAWRRGSGVAFVTAGFIVLIHAIPTFLVGELLAALRGTSGSLVLPILALSMGSLPLVMQQQRSSMLKALDEDYVRAARAKGARTLRVMVVHALRNALMPTVTLAGVQLPALVGGAFVIEEAFDVRGLGWETLRAIESHDVAWVVVVTLVCAIATTACLVASDVAYSLLDPRVRERQTRRLAA